MRKLVPLVVALIVSLGAHAQESETVSYERLGSMASEVISEYLNGPLCSPGPELAKKQAELAKLVSQATASTGPMVLEFAVMANSLSDVRRLHEGGEIPPGPYIVGTRLTDRKLIRSRAKRTEWLHLAVRRRWLGLRYNDGC